MDKFQSEIQLRWSDMDPNFHVRHSVYYDLAAQVRTQFFAEGGVTPMFMIKNDFGPVLFREEALFHKEMRYGDKIIMNAQVTLLKRNFSRFGVMHHLMRGDDICATITVEGAFIHTKLRRVTEPPQLCKDLMDSFPKAPGFKWVD